MTSVIANAVRREFGGREILRGLDLTLADGEFVALLGRSGTGKSTLLRILGGLDGDYSGKVLVPERRAVVFQEPRLLPWRRVLANVSLGLPPRPAGGRGGLRKLALDTLAEVGLRDHARAWPVTLSGGEAQRAALARALVREPQLMLLDEPFGALDALTRSRMHLLLQELYARHQPAVLLVTHDVDEAISLADRVIVLAGGTISLTEEVSLPRPRDPGDARFGALRARLLAELGVPGGVRPAAPVPAPVPPGQAALASQPIPLFPGMTLHANVALRPAARDGRGNFRRADLTPVPDRRRTDSAATIMRTVLDYGPVARSTIARAAGLSPAAISKQCAELIGRRLLREVPDESGGPGKPAGRPHVPLDIDASGPVACGVHLALTHATLSLVDLRGRVIAREHIPHGDAPVADAVLERIAARLPAFAARRPRVLGIGVATGGWVDSDAGTIVEHDMLGWRDVRVSELLERRTGLRVRVDGHSRALVRAEQLFGDHRARSSVLHLFVGNVVDAAFAVGGTVQHGPRSAAGTITHLPVPGQSQACACGRSGCLQAVASQRTLQSRAQRAGVITDGSFASLLGAASAGSPRAARMFRQRARAVGTAAAVLLDLLNPEVMVIAEAGVINLPGCLEALRAEVRRQSAAVREPPVVATSFGRDVLHVAAGTVLLSEVYTDPMAHLI